MIPRFIPTSVAPSPRPPRTAYAAAALVTGLMLARLVLWPADSASGNAPRELESPASSAWGLHLAYVVGTLLWHVRQARTIRVERLAVAGIAHVLMFGTCLYIGFVGIRSRALLAGLDQVVATSGVVAALALVLSVGRSLRDRRANDSAPRGRDRLQWALLFVATSAASATLYLEFVITTT